MKAKDLLSAPSLSLRTVYEMSKDVDDDIDAADRVILMLCITTTGSWSSVLL